MEAIITDKLDCGYRLLIRERLLLEEELFLWRIYNCDRISPANGEYDSNYLWIKLDFHGDRYGITTFQLDAAQKSIRKIFSGNLIWIDVVQPITPQDIAMYGSDKKIEFIIRDSDNDRSWSRIR